MKTKESCNGFNILQCNAYKGIHLREIIYTIIQMELPQSHRWKSKNPDGRINLLFGRVFPRLYLYKVHKYLQNKTEAGV